MTYKPQQKRVDWLNPVLWEGADEDKMLIADDPEKSDILFPMILLAAALGFVAGFSVGFAAWLS